MKVRVNHDLLDTIQLANEGVKFKLYMKEKAKNPISYIPCVTLGTEFILFPEHYKQTFLCLGFCFLSDCLIFKCLDVIKDQFKEENNNRLILISLELQNLGVETNNELLKDSKLDFKEYKLEYKDADNKVKYVKEYKYINVPDFNGNYETIVQEHFIGSDDYDLSIGENIKEMKLRLVRNNI